MTPIMSIVLPHSVSRVTFLDEYSRTDNNSRISTNLRWVAQLADSDIAMLTLSYAEEESLSSRFSVHVIFNTDIWTTTICRQFATDYAVGSSGGYIAWISVLAGERDKLPTYVIAPIRKRDDPPKSVIRGSHFSVEHPQKISNDGLPFSRSVSCLDFDDGHGILLIGSDAGQFCLVNFANALLPNDTFYGTLPMKDCLDNENNSKVAHT